MNITLLFYMIGYLCYHCSMFSILEFALEIGFNADMTDILDLYEEKSDEEQNYENWKKKNFSKNITN